MLYENTGSHWNDIHGWGTDDERWPQLLGKHEGTMLFLSSLHTKI